MGDRHGLLASTRTPAKRAGEVGALVATLQPAPCSRRAFSCVHFGTWMFAVWLRVWLHVWLFDFSGDGTPSQAPGHGNKKRPRLRVWRDRRQSAHRSDESVSVWGERTVEQGEEHWSSPTFSLHSTSQSDCQSLSPRRAGRGSVASHATKTTKIRAAKEDDARSHARAHSTELRRCRPCGG